MTKPTISVGYEDLKKVQSLIHQLQNWMEKLEDAKMTESFNIAMHDHRLYFGKELSPALIRDHIVKIIEGEISMIHQELAALGVTLSEKRS